jgi:stress response protein YsnF
VPVAYEKVVVERRPRNGKKILDSDEFESAVLGGSGVAVISSSDGGSNVLSSVSEIVVPLLHEVEIKKKIVVTDEASLSAKSITEGTFAKLCPHC